ncbi:MAG: acetyl-CoA C-acetyltransferase [Planctomycetes bacterium]|jgi:acetyl-CoA C-acetyltransferase|nr:acetyl-CoA C-acetyltransferase [Planctomycetota bacterium]
MDKPVIVSATRTPLAKFQGALASMRAPEIGAIAVKEAVRRAGIAPKDVQEVIMGNVLQAGLGQNPARSAAIHGGIPVEVPSMTVNKVCGSSLKAVALAASAVTAGDAEVVVAGGMENMSRAPYYLPALRDGARLWNTECIDGMVFDGLWDIHNNYHMGNTGELVAEKYGITRAEQDAYSVDSQRKACEAIKEGRFKDEIVPVPVPQKKGEPVLFQVDEGPRSDTTAESLAKLKPVFKKDGTVTAGNASTINDGASAVVVMAPSRAKAMGVKPMARILGYTVSGVDPKWVMIAPIDAVRMLWKKLGMKCDDFDLYELNEPFAVASVALRKELAIDPAKLNVNGGAVALGHPIGATGARILTTLLYALKARKKARGIASLCLGGGNAVAMAVEML